MWPKVFNPVAQTSGQLLCRRNTSSTVKANINFNSKHLAKGDPLPPYNGTLRLYNMRFCPFAQRTVLALNAKEIDYEIVNVNLNNKPVWLFEKSAFGKVPALEIKENVTIYESLVTVEYLDEIYPHRPLLPKDPVQKAYAKMIVEASGAIHNLVFKIVKKPENVNDENISAFLKSLDLLQSQLKSRGTKFLHGNEPGYSDYMIWPWLERLLAVDDIDARAKIDKQTYGPLINYIDNMMQDRAVSQYLVPLEMLRKFHDGFKEPGGANYDLLT